MSITYTATRQPAAASAAAAIRPGSAAGDTCNRPAVSVWLIPPVCPDTVRPAHTWRNGASGRVERGTVRPERGGYTCAE